MSSGWMLGKLVCASLSHTQTYMYINTHIYMYVYTYTYICTYMYTYIHI